MKKIFTFILIAAAFTAYGQQVGLDATFGEGGIVTTNKGYVIYKLLFDQDKNIISVGVDYTEQEGFMLTLMKNDTNGDLVTNFGNNGMVYEPYIYWYFPNDAVRQSDNKLIIAGNTSSTSYYCSRVVRYNEDGTIDSLFGYNDPDYRYLTLADFSYVNSIILLEDGNILFGGRGEEGIRAILAKANSGGQLVENFGKNGYLIFSGEETGFGFSKFILLDDNTVLMSGNYRKEDGALRLAYCKIDLDGKLVSEFGDNGMVIVEEFVWDDGSGALNVIKKLSDGKILLAGYGTDAKNILLKIDASDGSYDRSFGNNGIVIHDYPFTDMVLQPDEKILLGGTKELSEENSCFSVTRFTQDGKIDDSFNDVGFFDVDIIEEENVLRSILLQDNKLILGGSSKIRIPYPRLQFTLARINLDFDVSIEDEIMNNEILLYPNPTNGQLKIQNSKFKIQKIRLFDVFGRKVLETIETAFDIDFLPAGIYILHIQTDKGVTNRRIIKY